MLGGVNDRYEQAVALADLLQPRKVFKVNLIPYNPTEAGFRGSSQRGRERLQRGTRGAGRPHNYSLDAGTRHRRGLRTARRCAKVKRSITDV